MALASWGLDQREVVVVVVIVVVVVATIAYWLGAFMNEILKNHGRAPVRSQILQISRAAVAVVTFLCGK